MKKSTIEMSNEKEAAQEVAIERWENEGGDSMDENMNEIEKKTTIERG